MGFAGTVRRIWETSTRVPRRSVCSFLMSFLFSTGAVGSAAQNADITCDRGSGEYTTTFQTGITVNVNAVKEGELSTRKCDAKLAQTGGELVTMRGDT
jgi:hypothetical protein